MRIGYFYVTDPSIGLRIIPKVKLNRWEHVYIFGECD